MRLNILAFAIPLFVTFILLEYFIARKKKLDYFHLQNSFANISIGIAERLLDVFTTGIFFFVYDFLHSHFAIFKINAGIPLWVLLLICTDFVWYWYHRLAHEINIFWAVHVVHHQSEDFNYTVSARITVFQAVVRTGFWCILPVIGFPPAMITSMLLVHGLYPFFIHTRLIGNLGILEYILVTPSHHRVHHASNEEYLDKNYDIIIIDTPPFGIVADAQILGQWADVTLIVTRFQQTVKEQIYEINEWQQRNIFKSIALVFNGVKNKGYFGNKYGYYYYKSKYGYSYYSSDEKE